MYISYYDESGDDGFPSYSSPLFVLTSCYLHYLNWQETYEHYARFRSKLKEDYGLPAKIEFHTKYFILNKNPYSQFRLSSEDRVQIMNLFCDLIGRLKLQIINVAIVKTRIQKRDYGVLDRALTYSIQRIENDLNPRQNPENKFLVITDSGRVGKMRKTSRRLQKINYIPSKYGTDSYRQEIQSLIEDPLPKDSKESHFIQTSDLVAFVVYQYCLGVTGAGKLHGRMPENVNSETIKGWMERLKPSLNLKASGDDPYGVVMHPK
jgi:hypothetical protein